MIEWLFCWFQIHLPNELSRPEDDNLLDNSNGFWSSYYSTITTFWRFCKNKKQWIIICYLLANRLLKKKKINISKLFSNDFGGHFSSVFRLRFLQLQLNFTVQFQSGFTDIAAAHFFLSHHMKEYLIFIWRDFPFS